MIRHCLWAIIVLKVFFSPGSLFKDDTWYFIGIDKSTKMRVEASTAFPILSGDRLEIKCETAQPQDPDNECWYVRA